MPTPPVMPTRSTSTVRDPPKVASALEATVSWSSVTSSLSVALPADLRERLAALPDRLQEVLVLRYYHDLSEGEIAEIVGVPRGTVKSRLHTAVKTLRAGPQSDD